MKLTNIGNNTSIISFNDGKEVFFSYSTPVAAFVPGRGYLRTDRSFSRTTSKHINKYLAGAVATTVPHSEIVQLAG